MKKHALFIITLLLFTTHITHTTGGQTSLLPSGKPRVNCSVQVTMLDGKTIAAENLMIKSSYKKIPVYWKPSNIQAQQMPINKGHMKLHYALDKKPESHTVSIDLQEIARIAVPEPHAVWVHKGEKSETRFVEIVVEQGGTKNNYLIEANKTKVTFDVNTPAGPIEHTLNIEALKEIRMMGCKMAEEVQPRPAR